MHAARPPSPTRPAPTGSTGVAPNATDTATPTSCASARPTRARIRRRSASPTRRSRTGCSAITNIVVPAGSNLQSLNLPIDPDGVVYRRCSRAPVAGATLTLVDRGQRQRRLPSSCFDDPQQQGQVTRADGYYKFDLNFSDASCPSGGRLPDRGRAAGHGLRDRRLGESFRRSPGAATPPFPSRPARAAPDDAVPFDGRLLRGPDLRAGAAAERRARTAGHRLPRPPDCSTQSSVPGSSQLFNNHIPLDPVLDGASCDLQDDADDERHARPARALQITRQRTAWPSRWPTSRCVDRYPAGFRYIEGSARVDGVPLEPTGQRPRAALAEPRRARGVGAHTIVSAARASAPASPRASS